MSKLESRVQSLFNKTHQFFSINDLELLRDYRKAMLDEDNISAEAFKEECSELHTLLKKDRERFRKKLKETLEKTPHVYRAFMYEVTIMLCEENPKGTWLLKKSTAFSLTLQNAKIYFKTKTNL